MIDLIFHSSRNDTRATRIPIESPIRNRIIFKLPAHDQQQPSKTHLNAVEYYFKISFTRLSWRRARR